MLNSQLKSILDNWISFFGEGIKISGKKVDQNIESDQKIKSKKKNQDRDIVCSFLFVVEHALKTL